MSAYKQIKTEFRNIESLKKALADVGFGHFELSAGAKVNSLELIGYHGNVPAHAAIKLSKSHYQGFEDTGFVWEEASKSYRAVISTHDGPMYGGGGKNFGEGTLQALRQRYALHEIRRQAQVKGYTIREVAGADGVIRLQLTHR